MVAEDIAMKLASVGLTAGRGCPARTIAEQVKRLRDEGIIDSDTALNMVIELTSYRKRETA